jgi:hypothetical protein
LIERSSGTRPAAFQRAAFRRLFYAACAFYVI